MTREVFQDYDCPGGIDFDLHDDELVYRGQPIQCSGCGGVHLAGIDVEVGTYVDVDGEREYPDLPETADELQRLKVGTALSGD